MLMCFWVEASTYQWTQACRHNPRCAVKAVLDYGSFALRNICHELHWKVHFEVAAAFSREHNLRSSRRAIELAALSCPRLRRAPNLWCGGWWTEVEALGMALRTEGLVDGFPPP